MRGVNSLSLSNDPLLIIDGIRAAGTTNFVASGFGQSGGRLNDINPDDIESIEIVKGPSAATLYGTDAANGVIVIKTKRGVTGSPRWAAFGELGHVKPAVPFLDNYYSWGRTPSGVTRHCTLDLAANGTCTIDSLSRFNPFEDRTVSPIGTGLRRQLGLQVHGGASGLTYFLSGSSDYERSYLEMPAAERRRVQIERGGTAIPDEHIHPNWTSNTRLRSNVGVPFGQNADVVLSTALVLNETSIPAASNIFNAYEFSRGYRDPVTGGPGVWGNPGAPGEVFSVRNQDNTSHFTGSLASNWRPSTWLATRSTVGLDISENFLDALQRRGEGPNFGRTGRRQNTRSSLRLYSADLGATASFVLRPELTSKTSVGVQYNRNKNQSTSTSATGLASGSETITGASVLTASESNGESVVAGLFAEQTLGWRDRLFVTAAMRMDGGSSFGKEFKTATYPFPVAEYRRDAQSRHRRTAEPPSHRSARSRR